MLLLIAFISLSINVIASDLDVTFTPSTFEGGYNISCHGDNNGSIEAFPINGTSPYFYHWSNGATTKIITNLAAGTYTLTVTDFSSHTITSSIELFEPNATIGISLTTKNITEAGANDGEIDAVVNGGTPAYNYLWSTGSVETKIGDLSPGTYSLIVTDASGGCPATATATVSEPTALQIVSITSPMHHGYNLSCYGSKDEFKDGSINLVVSGGVPPYQYVWSNGNFTQDIEGLGAGLYMVKVLDDNGAEVYGQITLTQPALLDFGFTVSVYQNGYNLSCYECSNGEVTANPTNGVSPYSYLWESGETTSTLTNKSSGNYHVTITDANGCTTGGEMALTRPDRNDWTMLGNSGSDPSTQFLGTTDNKDFVLRTNNSERLRFKADGTISMPDNSHFDKLLASRITSMDSVIHIGDSSIVVTAHGPNKIYPSDHGIQGISFGSKYAYALNTDAIAIGHFIYADAANSMTIGSGIDGGQNLRNPYSNTLYLGFNSNVPTVVVTDAGGISGSTGKVGIGLGNQLPTEKLDVDGKIKTSSLAVTGVSTMPENSGIVIADNASL